MVNPVLMQTMVLKCSLSRKPHFFAGEEFTTGTSTSAKRLGGAALPLPRFRRNPESFAKSVILKGSFDTFAESMKVKRGTAEVGNAFLDAMESWRDPLTRNSGLRNPTLTVRGLNEAGQRTIDRIISLRIDEDRRIEEYGSLRGFCDGPNTCTTNPPDRRSGAIRSPVLVTAA